VVHLNHATVGRAIHLSAIHLSKELWGITTAHAKRAGIEGMIALATEPYGLRRIPYIGLAKTQLQNIFVALAINLAHVAAWWAGKPRAPTRLMKVHCTAFAFQAS
jgi:hypothetical protein